MTAAPNEAPARSPIILAPESLFESSVFDFALLGFPAEPLTGAELLAEEAEKKGEKKEAPRDAIMEAKAHLAELVGAGKPAGPKRGEKPDSPRVSAHFSTKPKNCYAAVSYSVRTGPERAKSCFENVKGLFPKAVRDVAYDRAAGGGQQHWSYRQENCRVSFRFVPGHERGSFGCTVYVRADSPQRAKAYFATLVGGLPGWAKQIYHESLTKSKHEAAEPEFFGSHEAGGGFELV